MYARLLVIHRSFVKSISDFPDKDDPSTHQATQPGKEAAINGVNTTMFGSKHCFPIERPLRKNADRPGKFEKRL